MKEKKKKEIRANGVCRHVRLLWSVRNVGRASSEAIAAEKTPTDDSLLRTGSVACEREDKISPAVIKPRILSVRVELFSVEERDALSEDAAVWELMADDDMEGKSIPYFWSITRCATFFHDVTVCFGNGRGHGATPLPCPSAVSDRGCPRDERCKSAVNE